MLRGATSRVERGAEHIAKHNVVGLGAVERARALRSIHVYDTHAHNINVETVRFYCRH